MRRRAFVKYTTSGKIISGSLAITQGSYPKGPLLFREVPVDLCCDNPVPPVPTNLKITMVFENLTGMPSYVTGNINNVDSWNQFFRLPGQGNPFTSVQVTGSGPYTVVLTGGSNITLIGRNDFLQGTSLVSFTDEGAVKYITYNTTYGVFSYCLQLTSVTLPELLGIYNYTGEQGAFAGCELLTSLSLPKLEEAWLTDLLYSTGITTIDFPSLKNAYCLYPGGGQFYTSSSGPTTVLINFPSLETLGPTTGDNEIFNGTTGYTFTVNVGSAVYNANGVGLWDGDLVYLNANNTCTINEIVP